MTQTRIRKAIFRKAIAEKETLKNITFRDALLNSSPISKRVSTSTLEVFLNIHKDKELVLLLVIRQLIPTFSFIGLKEFSEITFEITKLTNHGN